MTDRELLEDCLTAFDAIWTAPGSRRLLKKWGIAMPMSREGRALLADYMAKTIREHLEETQ